MLATADERRHVKAPSVATGKAPLSVIVPVRNEAENLKRCLPALAWADEVFVVDSRSSDETQSVAEEHGATVVQFQFNGTYPKKKNWALEELPFRNEWVLIVDADEVVVPELAAEIAERIAKDEADGYLLNSKYFFLGRRVRHCGYSEAWNLRLFRHRLGRYEKMPVEPGAATGDNEAHEHVELGRGELERRDRGAEDVSRIVVARGHARQRRPHGVVRVLHDARERLLDVGHREQRLALGAAAASLVHVLEVLLHEPEEDRPCEQAAEGVRDEGIGSVAPARLRHEVGRHTRQQPKLEAGDARVDDLVGH